MDTFDLNVAGNTAEEIVESLIDNGFINGKQARILFEAIRKNNTTYVPTNIPGYPYVEPWPKYPWDQVIYSCTNNFDA